MNSSSHTQVQALQATLNDAVNDIESLRAQRNALLEACKAALLRLDHHDEQSAPEALQLRNAIALAQGGGK
jgi:hypothetical protein